MDEQAVQRETGFAGELDRKIAQEIMGWTYSQLANGNYYYFTKQNSIAAHGQWSPTSNLHAFDRVFRRIQQSDTLCTVLFDNPNWIGTYSSQGITCKADGPSMHMAACKAMYAWFVKERGGDKDTADSLS